MTQQIITYSLLIEIGELHSRLCLALNKKKVQSHVDRTTEIKTNHLSVGKCLQESACDVVGKCLRCKGGTSDQLILTELGLQSVQSQIIASVPMPKNNTKTVTYPLPQQKAIMLLRLLLQIS